jgi:hypothetical protein
MLHCICGGLLTEIRSGRREPQAPRPASTISSSQGWLSIFRFANHALDGASEACLLMLIVARQSQIRAKKEKQ